MSHSQTARTALSQRERPARESVSTATGLAAERDALTRRERERQTTRARTAARRIDGRPAASSL